MAIYVLSGVPDTRTVTLAAPAIAPDFGQVAKICRAHGATPVGGGTHRIPADRAPALHQALVAAGTQIHCEPTYLSAIRQEYTYLQSGIEYAEKVGEERGLYTHQVEGVAWLRTRTHALLADDMGLGKTAQILCALPADRPVVVVVPRVVKGVWVRECERWRPDLEAHTWVKGADVRAPVRGEVAVVNYEQLHRLTDMPRGFALVADEAHYLKSSKATRTKLFRSLARRAAIVWGATGTPLLSRPPELWGVLQSLQLGAAAYGSWFDFCAVMGGRQGTWGMEWGTPTERAQRALSRVMLRRTKGQCLDLPAKSYVTHPVEFARRDLGHGDFDPATFGADDWQVPDITKFSALYARITAAKIPAMLDLVAEYEATGTPLVVMSPHRAPVDRLSGRKGWCVITGDTSPTERERIVNDFQDGKLRGVACTIQVAAVGLTLTHASTMLFVGADFVPANNQQAADRIHRIGQDKHCTYVYLHSNHPLDDRLSVVNLEKRELVEKVVRPTASDAKIRAGALQKYLASFNGEGA